ncbi:MAG: bifunctional glutamate N-acetyltransferase/amino-acid acetyltransferase ArgJ [Actinomycetota bacterium]|nr:bifunctional glutamate N-acetyltransferase/amino-acid acetyltransferase ArgJ [Actinomycetota bacterium]
MSVTAANGFVASGTACGIKPGGQPDLALVSTEDRRPVPAAAVFTPNLATAAPVEVSRTHLARTGGRAAAVILNSGNANAATGPEGRACAEETCAMVAHGVGCDAAEVLVCSTGLIGIPLPMASVRKGLPAVVDGLGPEGGGAAAGAILTTDTHAKEVVVHGDGFTVGGMAKGAAMLAPHLATMLAVLTTDADVSPAELHRALQSAARSSFNALSVDGCTSTNDTVIVLASGRREPIGHDAFTDALTWACIDLAEQMAADAEGATKLARITVTGAMSDEEAQAAARKVADSLLVKCSLYGQDPYWGRVVSELGSAGVGFDPDRVSVAYGDEVVCRNGVAASHDPSLVADHLGQDQVAITADLGLGEGSGTVVTSDLTHAYVDENMRTS